MPRWKWLVVVLVILLPLGGYIALDVWHQRTYGLSVVEKMTAEGKVRLTSTHKGAVVDVNARYLATGKH
jgi:hypothetical protein